ncbi:MAG: 30S ribosomal protein S16 [Chloroflexota bacterium]
MLRIRLRRVGAKKHPSYRIVVADSRSPRNGAFVDQVGLYNPMADPPAITLDDSKVRDWLSKGAQPSEPVQAILSKRGIPSKD